MRSAYRWCKHCWAHFFYLDDNWCEKHDCCKHCCDDYFNGSHYEEEQ